MFATYNEKTDRYETEQETVAMDRLAKMLYDLDHGNKNDGRKAAELYLSMTVAEQMCMGDWRPMCEHLVNVCL